MWCHAGYPLKDIVLINPSSKEILRNAGDRLPLGLLYLGASLKENGYNVKIRDLDHIDIEDLKDELNDYMPDIVGVSAYTSPLYKQTIELGKMLKGKTRTIVGGYHASAMPESLTDYFDCVITGYAEKSIINVIKNGLEGIVNSTLLSNPQDMNKILHPDRSLVDMKLYNFKQDGRPATTMLTSRGCYNNCVFCGNMNHKMRYHSEDFVIDEIKEVKTQGFNDIYFYDDAFISNKKRTFSLLEKIGKENIHYRITTRAESITPDIAKLLKNTGCSWVSLGIESGDDNILKAVGKNMTTEDNYNAIKYLSKEGIKTKGFFMFGLPNESKESAMKTIDFANKLKSGGLTTADFYIMIPFPGTPIWNNPEKYEVEIIDYDYNKYLEAGILPHKAFHKTKYMNNKEIEDMRNLAEEIWRQE